MSDIYDEYEAARERIAKLESALETLASGNTDPSRVVEIARSVLDNREVE